MTLSSANTLGQSGPGSEASVITELKDFMGTESGNKSSTMCISENISLEILNKYLYSDKNVKDNK